MMIIIKYKTMKFNFTPGTARFVRNWQTIAAYQKVSFGHFDG